MFTIFNLFGLSFGVIDLVFICLVLVLLVIGLSKGFVNLLLTTLKGIISYVVAFFLCKPLSLAFYSMFGDNVYQRILTWINSKGDLFTFALPGGEANEAVINEGLASVHLPEFINKMLVEKLADVSTTSLGETIASYVTSIGLTVLSFIIIAIVVHLVLFFIRRLFKKVEKKSLISGLDRVLGGLVGAVFGVALVCLVSMGLAYLLNSSLIPGLAEWLANDMGFTDASVKSLSKFLYDSNPIFKLLEIIY